jgi:RHS repeat-associated protein
VLLGDQKLEKLVVVLARVENVLAVPARDHMIKPALDLDPGFSWHKRSNHGIIIRLGENRNIASLTPISRYQFTGREPDPTTGLQFSRARFYDPKLGRFTAEDPIGFRGGDINVFTYVHNRPTMFTDPLGKQAASLAADPNVWRYSLPVAGAAGVACPAFGVAAVGGVAIYGAWNFGEWLAARPWNPLTQPRFPTGPIPLVTPRPVPQPVPLPYAPLGPNNPPRDGDRHDRCVAQCAYLLPSPDGRGWDFIKCYNQCMGKNL